MKRYTIKEYAAITGTSRAAVYKKLDTSLKAYVVKEGKRTFLLFPDDAIIQPGVNPDSTPGVDNGVDKSVNVSTTFNPDSTTFQPGFNPGGVDKVTQEVDRLTSELSTLKAVLEAKDAHLKDLQGQVDRLATELDQERQAGKELRQLLNQQQALTAKHLAEPKRKPLLAAIFPKWYNREDDQGQE